MKVIKVSNSKVTFMVIQEHRQCCYSIGYIWFSISLLLHRFRDIITYFSKFNKSRKTICSNFTKLLFFTCYPWLWLGPRLTAAQCVMYFWFCKWRHFNKWSEWARIEDDAYVSSNSLGGSTRNEVAVYDCRLVVKCSDMHGWLQEIQYVSRWIRVWTVVSVVHYSTSITVTVHLTTEVATAKEVRAIFKRCLFMQYLN